MSQPLINQQIMTAQTTSGTIAVFPPSLSGLYIESTVYVEFSAAAAAGTVVIETAANYDYAGTWANIATISWAAGSKAHYASVTGAFRAVRVRISSAITSGTVDAYVIATN